MIVENGIALKRRSMARLSRGHICLIGPILADNRVKFAQTHSHNPISAIVSQTFTAIFGTLYYRIYAEVELSPSGHPFVKGDKCRCVT